MPYTAPLRRLGKRLAEAVAELLREPIDRGPHFMPTSLDESAISDAAEAVVSEHVRARASADFWWLAQRENEHLVAVDDVVASLKTASQGITALMEDVEQRRQELTALQARIRSAKQRSVDADALAQLKSQVTEAIRRQLEAALVAERSKARKRRMILRAVNDLVWAMSGALAGYFLQELFK